VIQRFTTIGTNVEKVKILVSEGINRRLIYFRIEKLGAMKKRNIQLQYMLPEYYVFESKCTWIEASGEKKTFFNIRRDK